MPTPESAATPEPVPRVFTLAQAQGLLPEILDRERALIQIRAELSERVHAHEPGEGGIPEIKALEARMSEVLDWFGGQGIQVKGYAPLLIDFPIEHDGRTVLLCRLEGETELTWYHEIAHGFMGRRRLGDRPSGAGD